MNDIQQLFRVRPSQSGMINAPSLAYKCVYGKLPTAPLRGRYSGSPQQRYKDMFVDQALDAKILDTLNSIEGIEIRSVCAGHNSDKITYIIFRPYNQDLDYIEKITNQLNSGNTKAIHDVGNGGMYRICVATRNWYREDSNNNNWKQWWNSIATRIKKVV